MLWIKAFHIIFVICWFAGIFYLPRLYVNYAMVKDEAVKSHLLIMARKLYRFTTPFAFLTIVFGGILFYFNHQYYLKAGWFHTKLLLVVLLIIYHHICGIYLKQFEQGKSHRSHIFYRWFNEIPVFILFGSIILVVIKPF